MGCLVHFGQMDTSVWHRKERVLRVFTLLAFFHFSGINNGFTAAAALSPVSVPQSAGLAASLARDLGHFVQGRAGQAARQIHAWSAAFARGVQSWGRQMGAFVRGAAQTSSMEAVSGRSLRFSKAVAPVTMQQEPYMRERQETWKQAQALKEALSAARPNLTLYKALSVSCMPSFPRALQARSKPQSARRLHFASEDDDSHESAFAAVRGIPADRPDSIRAVFVCMPFLMNGKNFSTCYKTFTTFNIPSVYNTFQSFSRIFNDEDQNRGRKTRTTTSQSAQNPCQTLSESLDLSMKVRQTNEVVLNKGGVK